MNELDRKAWITIPAIVGAGAAVAWAGSQGGLTAGGIPIFALAAALAFGINWVAFVPAFVLQTERFFDLLGACLGALVVAALAIPLLGILGTCVLLGLLKLVSVIGLWLGQTQLQQPAVAQRSDVGTTQPQLSQQRWQDQVDHIGSR